MESGALGDVIHRPAGTERRNPRGDGKWNPSRWCDSDLEDVIPVDRGMQRPARYPVAPDR